MTAKVRLASAEWLQLAGDFLREIVVNAGDADRTFSMCEVFQNAPPGLVGENGGCAAWHFRIAGLDTCAAAGEVDDVDVKYILDYAQAEGLARIILSDEADATSSGVSIRVIGDPERIPPYLRKLHNRLAPITL